jgi:hypothetical protein
MTDNWPIIQLPPGPSDAELEAERDAKHAAETEFLEVGHCLNPAPRKPDAFGAWPKCALRKGHDGAHATLIGDQIWTSA